MGKRKRNKNNKVEELGDSDDHLPVRFSLEKNADQIFQEYLEKDFPDDLVGDKDSGRVPPGRTKKKPGKIPEPVIDLHGLHLDEAIFKVSDFLREQQICYRGMSPYITCKVITGKGLHSKNGTGVLAGEVYDFVKSHFKKSLIRIDPPPLDSTINGIPLKGHFVLTLKTMD